MVKKTDDSYYHVRGAIYIPSRAYNAYQMWNDMNQKETIRDMRYAQSLDLNAIRIWVSYEYWLEQPEELKEKFNMFLDMCSQYKIRVMPSLFENCGREGGKEVWVDRNPMTSIALRSPSTNVAQDKAQWTKPQEYIEWFMSNFGEDKRLLAIEIINEPHVKGKNENMDFAVKMLETASKRKKSIPLTIGCINLTHNLFFMEAGLDILQFHENFPQSEKMLENLLIEASVLQRITGKPVWITEWQRVRPSGNGWNNKQITEEEKLPKLRSLAHIIKNYDIGSFFWSLMLKPAYLKPQRLNGTFNGIFHEDGFVYNLDDAKSINDQFNGKELKSKPKWYLEDIKDHQR